MPDGSWLIAEMEPSRGCVTHISPDGNHRRKICKTGRPNGLAVDRDGTIWIAESVNPPSLARATMDGAHEAVMAEWNGRPLLLPNDLAFGPDGLLYLTDSGIHFNQLVDQDNGIRPDFMEMAMDGRVFRIDVKTMNVEILDSGLRFANGIAFGLDGDLYVSETLTGSILRYRSRDGVITGERKLFCQLIDRDHRTTTFEGPDGMAFDLNGCLYVAMYGQRNVTVIDLDGTVRRRITTRGAKPTNVAFGAPGERKIYVTEDDYGAVEVFDVDTDGLPLHH